MVIHARISRNLYYGWPRFHLKNLNNKAKTGECYINFEIGDPYVLKTSLG